MISFSDLSFNNIGKIEGLENNKKLKDLSLFNNQIKKIENVGFLQQLEVFSIGNNQLSDISDVNVWQRYQSYIFPKKAIVNKI